MVRLLQRRALGDVEQFGAVVIHVILGIWRGPEDLNRWTEAIAELALAALFE